MNSLTKSDTLHSSILPSIDYGSIKNSFLRELKNAADGQESSLPYIKHYLPDKPLLHQGLVQGIVIGGTNYILSTEALLPDGKREIRQRKTGMLPTFYDADIFYSFLKEHIDTSVQAIGLNFGFPLEPLSGDPHGGLDGKLLKGTKEHTFHGLIGKSIGDTIRAVVGKNIPVAVANDTVCLTLAGDGDEDGSIIAGTGFNIGIKQITSSGKKTVINLEAGRFNRFEPSEVLKIIDERSDMPGTQLFEKMISGKYLAQYFDVRAEKIGLKIPPITTSQELSALSNTQTKDAVSDLARALLERSAFLVAAAICAIYEFRGKKTLTLIGEGSLLWYGWHYQENLQKQLTLLGVPQNAVIMKHIQHSSINGAIALLIK